MIDRTDVMLAIDVARFIFHVPFHGNLLLSLFFSGLYACVGVGVGFLLATISRPQQQAIPRRFYQFAVDSA